MPNEENLINFSNRTKSEQREIAKKGGKASAKVRREKKTMKELAEMFASLPVTGKNKDVLTQLGIDESDHINDALKIVALGQRCLTGDPVAIKLDLLIRGLLPNTALTLDGNVQINSGGLKETLEELKKRD